MGNFTLTDADDFHEYNNEIICLDNNCTVGIYCHDVQIKSDPLHYAKRYSTQHLNNKSCSSRSHGFNPENTHMVKCKARTPFNKCLDQSVWSPLHVSLCKCDSCVRLNSTL